MSLHPDETHLVGSWVLKNGAMTEDEVSLRIRSLIKSELQRIATSKDGWEVLYKDLSDGRYWELTYPHSEMQGGGPIALILASRLMLGEKYEAIVDFHDV
jgi:hypothetical protein